jgi:hypothetical protein
LANLSKTSCSLLSWEAMSLIDLFAAVLACLDYSDMLDHGLFNIF